MEWPTCLGLRSRTAEAVEVPSTARDVARICAILPILKYGYVWWKSSSRVSEETTKWPRFMGPASPGKAAACRRQDGSDTCWLFTTPSSPPPACRRYKSTEFKGCGPARRGPVRKPILLMRLVRTRSAPLARCECPWPRTTLHPCTDKRYYCN